MNKRYQIFVSSTYSDLQEERSHVINELNKDGHIAAGMEQFPATHETQMEYIRPIIDDSDYYIVIVRGKYGSLAANSLSFTENEFDYAVSQGKRAFAFIFKDQNNLLVSDTDKDPDKLAKLNTFVRKLTDNKIVNFWTDKSDLASQVSRTISSAIRQHPAIGWVRGDQIIDASVVNQAEKLRQENAELKEKLAAFENEAVSFPAGYAWGDDEVVITFLSQVRSQSNPHSWDTVEQIKYKTTYDEILLFIKDDMYKSAHEVIIGRNIASFLGSRNGYNFSDASKLIISYKSIEKLRHSIENLGLIKIKNISRSIYETEFGWDITEKGRMYFGSKLADRKMTV